MPRDEDELWLAQCTSALKLVLAALPTPTAPSAVSTGDKYSAETVMAALREGRARVQVLKLDEQQTFCCPVFIAVGMWSICMKLNFGKGMDASSAWRLALDQPSHVWALHLATAAECGEAMRPEILQYDFSPRWISECESSLLQALGRGFWDVYREKQVKKLMECIHRHMDLEMVENLTPRLLVMYFELAQVSLLNAAFLCIQEYASERDLLLLQSRAWLQCLEDITDRYRPEFQDTESSSNVAELHKYTENLVHCVVLLLEFIHLCFLVDESDKDL